MNFKNVSTLLRQKNEEERMRQIFLKEGLLVENSEGISVLGKKGFCLEKTRLC